MIAQTPRLIIRNWQASDEELFYHICSDDKVMEFFPSRRNREEAREAMSRLIENIAKTGYGFFAIETKEDNQPVGFAGLAIPELEPFLPKGTVEIGWRLAADKWGKGYATEAATELLRLGFEDRRLDEIVSFAVAANTRSTAVMKRLGMLPDPTRDFDHPGVPDSHIHLRRHVLYALSAQQWRHGRS
ncbi:MAG: GNAT family N-acetyltransferase [Pseudomonadota bacterium]